MEVIEGTNQIGDEDFLSLPFHTKCATLRTKRPLSLVPLLTVSVYTMYSTNNAFIVLQNDNDKKAGIVDRSPRSSPNKDENQRQRLSKSFVYLEFLDHVNSSLCTR